MYADNIKMGAITKADSGGGEGIPSYYVLATDDDFSGSANDSFKYIGTDEYVILPPVIKGINITSAMRMFGRPSGVLGVATESAFLLSCERMFDSNDSLTLDLTYLDVTNVTTYKNMFYLSKVTEIIMPNSDYSNSRTFEASFVFCYSLSKVDIRYVMESNWSSYQMFRNAARDVVELTVYVANQEVYDRISNSNSFPSNVNIIIV